MIRVLVVEDHELVRAGICRLLESDGEIEVVANTGSGHEAVELCRRHQPDVLILDYGLPDLDCVEVIHQLEELENGVHILVLTMCPQEDRAIRVLRAGASGCIAKDASAAELFDAIREVNTSGLYANPTSKERLVEHIIFDRANVPESALSKRELQVLVGIARGMTTKEVAASLAVNPKTAQTYRGRILGKLALRNNSDMTRFAIRRGLIELE